MEGPGHVVVNKTANACPEGSNSKYWKSTTFERLSGLKGFLNQNIKETNDKRMINTLDYIFNTSLLTWVVFR